MRRLMTWTWVALMVALFAGCLVAALSGCRSPGNTEPPPQMQTELEQMSTWYPDIWKILGGVLTLGKGALQDLARYIEKLNHRQELQTAVRHWLIVGAVASGLFALAGTLGKLLAGRAAAASVWAIPLAWVARQAPWHAFAVSGLLCGCCIALAVYLVPVWAIVTDLFWVALFVGAFYAGWVLSCRRYTGEWHPDGLVTLPAGWKLRQTLPGPVQDISEPRPGYNPPPVANVVKPPAPPVAPVPMMSKPSDNLAN